MRCSTVLRRALLIVLGGLTLPAVAIATLSFYAQYRNLVIDPVDYFGTDAHLHIGESTMSKDGRWLAFYGQNTDTATWRLYRISAAGGMLTSVPMPANPDNTSEAIRLVSLTISEDGSRIFFSTAWYQHRIYRWDAGGGLVQVIDFADYDYLTRPPSTAGPKVRTTANGSWVYFQEDRDDLWRVAATGGAPERVVDDITVIRHDGNRGWAVGDYDISDDGSTVVFILAGYRDSGGTAIARSADVFVGSGVPVAGPVQMTSNGGAINESYARISGDGSMVTYLSGNAGWHSVRADGSGTTMLEPFGFNVGGTSLTYYGDRMFYFDTEASGGRITRTDGSGGLDILPASNVAQIVLVAHFNTVISKWGDRVAFRQAFTHDANHLRYLYVGQLNAAFVNSPAPSISSMVFSPPAMPDDDPAARVTLSARISDPGGLAAIDRTDTNPLLDGTLDVAFNDLPVLVETDANDGGTGPDTVAGDGVFTGLLKPGSAASTEDSVTIRQSAMNTSRHVTVADRVLPVIDAGIAPPPVTNLLAPLGTIADRTPVYEWAALATATSYRLIVDGPEGRVIDRFYDAASVCPTAICSVQPTTPLGVGTYRWWVEGWNAGGPGALSGPASFTVAIYHQLQVVKSGSGIGTVVSTPSGISCGSTCEWDFLEGAVVALSPIPAIGSEFTGWNGGDTDCDDGSVTMASAKSCTAAFDLCTLDSTVQIPYQTITTNTTFEACNFLEALAGLRILGGTSVFRAWNAIVFGNGLEVAAGATIEIGHGAW